MRLFKPHQHVDRHAAWIAVVVAMGAVLMTTLPATAREKTDDQAYVVQLSAEQITAVTSGYTWTIENKQRGSVSQTYYRSDGVRFTRAGGRISQLRWSVKEPGIRCVHAADEFRCGVIADINGDLTICMTIAPMGDCNYRVLTRRPGDTFQLETLYKAQSQQP